MTNATTVSNYHQWKPANYMAVTTFAIRALALTIGTFTFTIPLSHFHTFIPSHYQGSGSPQAMWPSPHLQFLRWLLLSALPMTSSTEPGYSSRTLSSSSWKTNPCEDIHLCYIITRFVFIQSEEAKKKKGEPNRILAAFSLLQNFEFVVSTKKVRIFTQFRFM